LKQKFHATRQARRDLHYGQEWLILLIRVPHFGQGAEKIEKPSETAPWNHEKWRRTVGQTFQFADDFGKGLWRNNQQTGKFAVHSFKERQ